MNELRYRWWIWCIDGSEYDDSVRSTINYALRSCLYWLPVAAPIAVVLTVVAEWRW